MLSGSLGVRCLNAITAQMKYMSATPTGIAIAGLLYPSP
jgi:hypothetical protein